MPVYLTLPQQTRYNKLHVLHLNLTLPVLQCPAYHLQLVKVAGCNMWVMEEKTDDLSSDPPQVGHPWQIVHAQQLSASSQVGHSQPKKVMEEETDGPSSDPPQTGHPQPKKVHTQQYPACSHKATAMDQDALSLRIAGKH